MGHCISVYLIKKSDLRDDKIDSIVEDKKESKIKWTELKEGILVTTNIPNIKDWAKNKTVAKIETDYFGGSGYQTAKLFVDNKKVYDENDEHNYKESPINSVLKMMNVQCSPNMDEFDTIGLGSYRSNDDFNK